MNPFQISFLFPHQFSSNHASRRKRCPISLPAIEFLEERRLLAVLTPISENASWASHLTGEIYENEFLTETYEFSKSGSAFGGFSIASHSASAHGAVFKNTFSTGIRGSAGASFESLSYPDTEYTSRSMSAGGSYSGTITYRIDPSPDTNEQAGDPVGVSFSSQIAQNGGVAATANGTVGSFSVEGTIDGIEEYFDGAVIGDTVTLSVSGSASSSGDLSTDISLASEGWITVSLYKIPNDIVVQGKLIEWQPATGGVEFQYEVQGATASDLSRIKLYWGTNGTPIGNPVYNQPINTSVGTHGVIVTPEQLGAPPTGANQLILRAEGDEDDSNNTQTLDFNPMVMEFSASIDGNPATDIIGRFFSGISVENEKFSVKLSPDLTALRPEVVLVIGSTNLTLTPTSGNKQIYQSANFDPGTLSTDTQVTLRVTKSGRNLTRTSGAALLSPKTIDIEPIPAWMTRLFGSSLQESFDPTTQKYGFAGMIADLSTDLIKSAAKGLTLPKTIPLGGGQSFGINLKFNVEVFAPLNAQSYTIETSGTAALNVVGKSFSIATPSGFDADLTLTPQTLELSGGEVSFQRAGDISMTLFDGDTPISVKKVPGLNYLPNITTNLHYMVDAVISFDSQGVIRSPNSVINLDLTAPLGGSIDPQLSTSAATTKKVLSALSKLNLPSLLLSVIKSALQEVGLAPTVTMNVVAQGNLTASASIRLSKSLSNPTAKVERFQGRATFNPKVTVIPSWFGISTTIEAPQSITELFSFDIGFGK